MEGKVLGICLGLLVVLQICAARQGRDENTDKQLRAKRASTTKIVTTILEHPYMAISKDKSKTGNDRFEGFIADVLKKLATKVGFQYKLQIVKDGKYGAPLADGNWNGMIGEVMKGTADIAAAPLTILRKREDVVDFTMPFMQTGTTIIMKNPASGKLTVKSATDLAQQSDIQYGLVKDGVTEQFFQNSTIPTYQRMWSVMSSNPSLLVKTVEEGVNRAKANAKYAFIMDSAMADYWVGSKPCDLQIVGHRLNALRYGLATAKGSPLKDQISNAILQLHENGDLEVERRKWWPDECNDESTSGSTTTTSANLALMTSIVFASFSKLL